MLDELTDDGNRPAIAALSCVAVTVAIMFWHSSYIQPVPVGINIAMMAVWIGTLMFLPCLIIYCPRRLYCFIMFIVGIALYCVSLAFVLMIAMSVASVIGSALGGEHRRDVR